MKSRQWLKPKKPYPQTDKKQSMSQAEEIFIRFGITKLNSCL